MVHVRILKNITHKTSVFAKYNTKFDVFFLVYVFVWYFLHINNIHLAE